MFENIIVGVMVAIIVVAGLWAWWSTKHSEDTDTSDKNIEE